MTSLIFIPAIVLKSSWMILYVIFHTPMELDNVICSLGAKWGQWMDMTQLSTPPPRCTYFPRAHICSNTQKHIPSTDVNRCSFSVVNAVSHTCVCVCVYPLNSLPQSPLISLSIFMEINSHQLLLSASPWLIKTRKLFLELAGMRAVCLINYVVILSLSAVVFRTFVVTCVGVF